MKRIAIILTVIVAGPLMLGLLANASGGLARAAAREEPCSVATLQGEYLWSGESRFPHPDPRVNIAVGTRTYDGKGSLVNVQTISRDGVISIEEVATGEYVVNPNCTGTERIGTVNWYFVLTKDGTEGQHIRIDNGTLGLRSIKKR